MACFRKTSRNLLLLALMIVSIHTASAQTRIRVVGTVLDERSRTPISGASVTFIGVQKTSLTDGEGKFILDMVAGVRYEISVSSIGYARKAITDFDPLQDNEPIIGLTPSAKNMEEIVVKNSARKETIAILFSMQRNSPGIQDGIAAEMIRKSPDRNTGDVLRRVSGATVQDNKFVVIRGLNERYNIALLNKGILPSTEPDKKAFSFDIIPSGAIDNVIIYKSPLPDLPGDFSGGLVQVITRDYPTKNYTEFSVSTSANTYTTGKDFYSSTYRGRMDPLGFFQSDRRIPSAYAESRGSKFITLPTSEKQRITKLFPATYAYDGLIQSPPAISLGINGGGTRVLKAGGRIGLLYMVGYSNGRRVSDRNRTDYMINGQMLFDNHTRIYEMKNSLSGLTTLTFSKGRNKYSLKALFNNEYSNALGLRTGYDISNLPTRFDYKSYNNELQSAGIGSVVIDANHALGSKLTVDWTGSINRTYKHQPDQKIISFRTPTDKATPYYIKLGNENSPEIRNAGRIFSDLFENIYNLGFNLTYKFTRNGQEQKLKMGSLNYYRYRQTVVDAVGYSSLDFRGVTIYETKASFYSNIFDATNIDQYKLTLATIGNNSTSYTANAMLNSAYAMYDGRISKNLKAVGGFRFERYGQELKALGQADVKQDNTDVLPSFMLTYSPGKSTNVRLGSSRSVNRPEFRELASYSVFDYDNFVVVRGNPALKRSLITNVDLRYERFPSAGEIMSVSLFYKYFQRPIEQINAGNDVLSYQNADVARTYGAEVEIRKKLDFLSSPVLSDFVFYANASYMIGNVQLNGANFNSPLQGQSPYIVNGSLSYNAKGGTSFSLMYNKVGPRLKFRGVSGGAFNIYEAPRDLVDFQVNIKMFKGKVDCKFSIVDVLAQPFRWYYKFDPNPLNNYFDASKDRYINSSRFGTGINGGIKINL